MRRTPVNLIGGFYTDDALPWSAQDTVNFLPVRAEVPGPRTQWRLRGAPGLKAFTQLMVDEALAGPVRGARNVEGKLFVVAGDQLFEVQSNGAGIVRGTIPGVGRVAMSHNQLTAGGNQLIVVNGSAGYIWNTGTSTFAKITDPGYVGSSTVGYIDQYFAQVDPVGRFWYHSGLQNGLEYNTLDRYTSEADPDGIVAIAVNQLEVVVFNQKTTEFFANQGGAQRTFASKRIVIGVGCAGRHTVANLADTLFWLGNDGVVYQLNGYGAKPISTSAIEKAIAGKNWSQAFATTYESEGHKVYYLTFPDGHTWGYDLLTGLWARRESFGFERWRVNTLTFWNNKWIAGDFQTGKLYEVDWGTFDEAGANLISQRTTAELYAEGNAFTVDYAELEINAGAAPLGVDHALELTYSDDGARNWKNWKRRSLGLTGQYRERVTYRQLGISRGRVWRFRISSRGKRDVLGAVVQLSGADA